MNELRRAARVLARTPAFSVTVSLLLTLGIGASTVVFSFFEAVLLKPLPVPRPEELVRVVQRLPRVGTFSSFPETYYDALRGATTLALAFGEAGQDERFALTAPAPAENVSLRGVTPTFFDALRAQPLRGRVLVAADEELGADTPPALLSYRLWRRRFGGNPDAIGTATLAVNGRSFVVVGVMPEGFNGIAADSGADLWIPLSAYRTLIPDADDAIRLDVAARLKPGVERAQAQAECLSLWQSRMSAYYRDVEQRPEDEVAQMVARGIDVDALGRGVSILRDNVDGVLRIVIASTLLLLLIVCLNVGGILIARAAARQQELALRLALGASRLTLLRPLLAEGLLLAVLGAVGGVLLAVALIPFGREVLPPIRDRSGTLLPLTMAVGIDWRVGVFVGIITLLAMLSFTVAPAVFVARSHLDGILRSVRSTSAGSGRHMLMLFQVALCTFLLLTAGLFVRTLQELRRVDTGFEVNQIATFTGDLGARADASAFLTTFRDRIREIPGVRSVSVSSVAVMRGRGVFWTVARTGERITRAHLLGAAGNIVSADYFDTMGMRIVGGRGFSVQENATIGKDAAIQAVVNQAFVARFFGDVDAIGKRFGTPVNGVAGGRHEIVGVVNDAKYRSIREATPPTFYALGVPSDTFVMNVRASIRPDAVIEPVRKALASVDSLVPFREVHVMSDEVDNSMASERLLAILASSVGLCAALFVGAGIYGSLTYIATQRQREIAIRLALGGGRIQTAALVARRTLAMVVAGVIAGLAAALMAATGVRSMLFNVSPYDAPSAALAVAFVAATATAAMAVPLMRAIRSEPAEGLRLEQ